MDSKIITNKYKNDSWSKNFEELSKVRPMPKVPKEYSIAELRTMNVSDPYKNSIRIPHESTTCKYVLQIVMQ